MNRLICERCGKEIQPGDEVEMIGPEDFEGRRIFLDDEMLVVHKKCPDDEVHVERQYLATFDDGMQFMVELWSDGQSTGARRMHVADVWGPPVDVRIER